MDNVILYIKESYNELLHKVTWPSWSDLLASARLVLIGTIIIALIVFLMDAVFKGTLEPLYEILK